MADWAKPTISSNYLEVLALLGARDTDAATQFATGTPENTPVGAVKFSRTARRWEAWNGEAWAPLAAKYAISIDGDAAGAPWAGITGKPDAFTPAAHSHAASELAALLGSATPKPSAATASAGTAAKAAREDHAHQLPANATQSAAGLMSAADKAALDALPGQVSAADAKATAATNAATAADGKATEAKNTADAAKLTADGLSANVNAVDVKATNAASAAAIAQAAADAAQNTANAAKSSADSSVKTVNGQAPVGGNVSIPVASVGYKFDLVWQGSINKNLYTDLLANFGPGLYAVEQDNLVAHLSVTMKSTAATEGATADVYAAAKQWRHSNSISAATRTIWRIL